MTRFAGPKSWYLPAGLGVVAILFSSAASAADPPRNDKSAGKAVKEKPADAAPKTEPKAPAPQNNKQDDRAAPQDKPAPAPDRAPTDAEQKPTDTRDQKPQESKGDRSESRDVGDVPRDTARDTPRDTTRDGTRDSGDSRYTYRTSADQWQDRMRDERGDYRWQNFRGADIGLWFGRGGDGLVIADVGTTGVVARLGFHEGDRIVSVNGQRVVREGDFIRFLFAPEFRDRRVTVIVLRDGREETIYVEPRLIIEEFSTYQSDPLERYGLIIDDRLPDRIVVVRVVAYSPAYYAGIRVGDVIVSVRGERVRGPQEFVRHFERLDSGSLALEVNRNNRTRSLELEVGAAQRRETLKPNIDGKATPPADKPELREEKRDDRGDKRSVVVPPGQAEVEVSPQGTKVEVDTDGRTPPPRRPLLPGRR